ncbi:MAG: LysR family transcriptional regulator [Candidatus Binatia bacterium]
MTLHQLRVFAKVAELQSFTEAAKALHLTQPSVSALIQDLVGELKYKLFERRGIKMALTPEGKVLLRRTQQALTVLEGTKDEIAEVHGLKKSKLTVGGSAIAGATFLPEVVQRFKKSNSKVEVSLIIERSEILENKLLRGDLDMAVLGRAPHSPLLTVTLYREEEVSVIASPKHPLAGKRSVPLEFIAKEPLIVHEKGTAVRDMVERRFAERRLPLMPALEVPLQVGTRDAIRRSVMNRLGIGFLPKCHVLSDIEAGRLKVLNVPGLKLKRSLYIAVHKNRETPPLCRAFVAFLRRHKKR